jgi:hypothetical protein
MPMRDASDEVADRRPRVVIEPMTSHPPDTMEWVWHERIAEAAATLIFGDPEQGKSQIAIDIAARISIGAPWPDGRGRAPLGDVLIVQTEDHTGKTVSPRLAAAGGDPRRVHVLRRVDDLTKDGRIVARGFRLKTDTNLLRDQITALPDLRAVIIDPLNSYMTGADIYKDSEVRDALNSIVTLAEERNFALIMVSHPPKGSSTAMGSVAFEALVRAVWMAGRLEQDGEQYYLCRKKGTLTSPKGHNLTYHIEGVELPHPTDPARRIKTSRVVWDGVTSTSYRDLSRAREGKTGGGSANIHGVMKFLRQILRDGPVKGTTVIEQGAKAGFTEDMIRKAAGKLDVAMRSKGRPKVSWWSDPAQQTKMAFDPEGDDAPV